ncbi:MAG: hypothetical protein IPK33_13175 [Gemmatimonadetes bacterium]|nr:hypothetical protein [Gemmatimonadota bacterium]
MRTLAVVRTDRAMRFVFGSLIALALFASTIYVVMTYSVQTVMGRGTKGVGYLGGTLGAGMIVGSLLVGTVGSRWDKRRTILVGEYDHRVADDRGRGVFLLWDVRAPVAFLGGALLAPVMVSQDTLLHENAPPTARALIFSTKDLILAGVFMLSALLVGDDLPARCLEWPNRIALALAGVGLAILTAGVAGQLSLVADRRRSAQG